MSNSFPPHLKAVFRQEVPHRKQPWPNPTSATFPVRDANSKETRMCRNIHTLFNFEPPATEDEVRAAAEQYVRKVSGFSKPSQANAEAFARAVDEVTCATTRLLDSLVTSATPRDREVEAARARARAAKRFAAA
jgi:hypothetical protein